MSEPILGAYGLKYTYTRRRSSPKTVFEDVSFELRPGEFLTLLGPNGSGKSTLMKLVAGILPMGLPGCEGQVRYRGQDFLRDRPAFRARTLAYVGYDFGSEFPVTAYEAVMLARTAAGSGFAEHISVKDREAVRWTMELCLCWDWRDQDLQTLSGGERQLVSLARALAQGAKILFLDEALSQMDLHHQAHIGKTLKGLTAQGWSVVLVSHDVNLATEWADTALLLASGGKVAQGPVRVVMSAENLKKLYPGASLVVGASPTTGAPKVFFAGIP